jgi:hypothetical protein
MQPIFTRLDYVTDLTSLSMKIRALAITGHCIVEGLGQSEDSEQFIRHFFFMERGTSAVLIITLFI